MEDNVKALLKVSRMIKMRKNRTFTSEQRVELARARLYLQIPMVRVPLIRGFPAVGK